MEGNVHKPQWNNKCSSRFWKRVIIRLSWHKLKQRKSVLLACSYKWTAEGCTPPNVTEHDWGKKHTVTHFGLVKSPWVSDALAWRVWFQLAMARCSPQKQALKFRVFEWMKYITVLYIIYNQDNLMLMKINCPSQFYSFWCFPKAAPHAKAWSGFGCSPRIFRTSACSPENKINLNQEDWI